MALRNPFTWDRVLGVQTNMLIVVQGRLIYVATYIPALYVAQECLWTSLPLRILLAAAQCESACW